MRFHSQVLTDSEKEQVHNETLRVLGEAGVRFHSEKALKFLESSGARVDWDKHTCIHSIGPGGACLEDRAQILYIRRAQSNNMIILCRHLSHAMHWMARPPLLRISTQANIATERIKIMKMGFASFNPWTWA